MNILKGALQKGFSGISTTDLNNTSTYGCLHKKCYDPTSNSLWNAL